MERVVLSGDYLAILSVEGIINRQLLDVPIGGIAAHIVVSHLQVELVALYPRVQSRGHIGGLIFPTIDGALDLQVIFTVVTSRDAESVVLVRDYLPGLAVE